MWPKVYGKPANNCLDRDSSVGRSVTKPGDISMDTLVWSEVYRKPGDTSRNRDSTVVRNVKKA